MTEALDFNAEPKDLHVKFDNPVFHGGVNITVRDGAKWANTAKMGDILWVIEPDDDERQGFTKNGEVCGILHAPLDDIPAGLHKLNHDPKCRTKAGIKAELDRIYGANPWPGHRMVTVLFFYNPT